MSLLAACNSSAESAAADAALAQSLLEQRRIAEARLAINRAIAEQDSEADYHLLLAQIELTAGSTEGAFVAFSDALSLDGTNGAAMAGVAQTGLEIGRLDESKAAAERILTFDSTNVDALTILGLIEYLRRRYRPSLGYAEQILEIDPANEGGAILATRALFKRGEVVEARNRLTTFEKLGGITSGSARTRLEVARHDNDAAAMEAAFADLARLMPGDLAIAIDRADFLFKRGRRDLAMDEVETALVHKEASAAQIATTLGIVAEYAAADLLARRAPQILPAAAPATRIAMARLFVDSGQYAAAAEALEGDRGNDAAALRALALLRQGQVEQAGTLARAVVAADEDHCDALIVSAQISLRGGRPQDAVRMGQRAAAQCPELVEGWAVTARAHAAKDDIINARRVFRDGVAALPQSTLMARRYADWLLAQGAEREAVATARRLTRKAPALLSGWALYETVCRKAADGCAAEAAKGLAEARVRYGVDPRPGERQAYNLFGRFERE